MNITSVAIIIPSYNESTNLAILIPRIIRIVPKVTVIVVDDSSGDERIRTKDICLDNRKSVIYVARQKKDGRGSAVIDGMKTALAKTSATIMIEMDADLAHNPQEIPRLCAPIGKFDVVVGSRYMKGSIIVSWTRGRLIQSKIINFFLTYWLGLRMTDYTNGFRAYSRSVCQYLVTVSIHEKGFIALR